MALIAKSWPISTYAHESLKKRPVWNLVEVRSLNTLIESGIWNLIFHLLEWALWYSLLVLLLCGKLTDTLVMRGNGFLLFTLHILLLNFFLLDANQLVLLAFWCVVLLGLPFWWKTTEVYRAHLPIAEVESWQTREVIHDTRKGNAVILEYKC
jgi:hypothetical protein